MMTFAWDAKWHGTWTYRTTIISMPRCLNVAHLILELTELDREQSSFKASRCCHYFSPGLQLCGGAIGRATDLQFTGSWVWFLAGHHCIVALGKLLTPVCLYHVSSSRMLNILTSTCMIHVHCSNTFFDRLVTGHFLSQNWQSHHSVKTTSSDKESLDSLRVCNEQKLSALDTRGFPVQKPTHHHLQRCKAIGCDVTASSPCSETALNSLMLQHISDHMRKCSISWNRQ